MSGLRDRVMCLLACTPEQLYDSPARTLLMEMQEEQDNKEHEDRGRFHDVVTHRHSWRKAICIAIEKAEEQEQKMLADTCPAVRSCADADLHYWRHELRAFDRTFEMLGERFG